MDLLKPKTDTRKAFYWGAAFLIIAILAITAEAGIGLFEKLGKLKLIRENDLPALAKGTSDKYSKPIYIAHPYFGYIYTPGNKFVETTYMESNSAGFIDKEFPSQKEPGVYVYGLLGGSAAMSWGTEKEQDRLAGQLERLLNTFAVDERHKKFRVLNMGVGSQIQYQSTQIYLYYQKLLDGVIFYVGNNECSHLTSFWDDYPSEFPVWKTDQLQLASYPDYQAFRARQRISRVADYFLSHRGLLRLNTFRLVCTLAIRSCSHSVETTNRDFLAGSGAFASMIPHNQKPAGEQLEQLQKSAQTDFLYNGNPELMASALRKVLPVIFTEPAINAFAVAKLRGVPFLLVIQPMPAALDEKDYRGRYAKLMYQKIGNEILEEESGKLRDYGIKVLNLNSERGIFGTIKGEPFIDQSHLTPEGNRIVAQRLFEYIRKEWLNARN